VKASESTAPKGYGLLLLVAVAILVAAATLWVLRSPDAETPATPVPDPDTGSMHPAVAQLVTDARQAILDQRTSAAAWGRLGAVCDAHELYECASPSYREARSLEPEDVRWPYLLAIVSDRQGASLEEVVGLFREASSLEPEFAPSALRLGEALLRGDQLEQARAAFERALQIDAELAVAERGLGQTLLALGEPESAVVHLRNALRGGIEDTATLASLARAYAQLGRLDEAGEASRRSREASGVLTFPDPIREQVSALGSSSFHLATRARQLMEQGDFVGAIEPLRLLVEAEPDQAKYQYTLGFCYSRTNRTDAAFEHLGNAVRLGDLPEAHAELASLLASLGRIDAAIGHYRDALSGPGENPPLLRAELAEALARKGEFAAAVVEFELAGSQGPLNQNAYANWGTALLLLGRTAECVAPFESSLELGEPDPSTHLKLGFALEREGRREEAANHYRAARRIDPQYPIDQRRAQLAASVPRRPGTPAEP
jgi:tetratricopeptide (TPR) repeat protein